MEQRPLARLVGPLVLFAVSFGFVEGAVVVYLRQIGYPDGFRFPLATLPPGVAATEVAREAATIAMLLGMAFASARDALRRFAVFALCFGLWDLVYYAVLRGILGWPSSWFEWDVLFLIPAVWTGPVLAPVLVSLALVAASLLLLSLPPRSPSPLRARDWAVEAGAGAIIVASFLWNASVVEAGGVPRSYPWGLFWTGYLVGAGWFARGWLRHRRRGLPPAERLDALESGCYKKASTRRGPAGRRPDSPGGKQE